MVEQGLKQLSFFVGCVLKVEDSRAPPSQGVKNKREPRLSSHAKAPANHNNTGSKKDIATKPSRRLETETLIYHADYYLLVEQLVPQTVHLSRTSGILDKDIAKHVAVPYTIKNMHTSSSSIVP